MNFPCRWETLLISLWIQVGLVPGIRCKDGTVRLSREDVLLFKDEQDPKCFTRTEQDFTCFFETADNRTYDLLYKVYKEERCHMAVQTTEEGTFLHICSFPYTDVFVYVETLLEVVECKTNISIYKRTVFVEDHFLLDPPFNVSLYQNGQAGQLQVSWHTKLTTYCGSTVMHRIRYSSQGLGERIKEESRLLASLESLVPGEEVEVQVTVKCSSDSGTGHWSSWSQPVKAIVPQSADDVSLTCYTPDLQNITCQWNGSRYGKNEYKLFYKKSLSNSSDWTEWTESLANGSFNNLGRFHGDESRQVKVKLSSTAPTLSRTFFTQEFTLKNIKTPAPGDLRGAVEKGRLCLKWEAPLLSLSPYLQYEVGYQTREGEAWMVRLSLEHPETGACLQVPAGTQYSVKVRAKPNGSRYSGYWSDWSDVLTGQTSTDTGLLLMLCIPVSILITAIILIYLSSMYLSKLKQYFWPPVPNLDKVLQGFLTEINRQEWSPAVIAKQCSEEPTSSVVEILSEDKASGLGKKSHESTLLLSPVQSFSSREQVDRSPGTEVFPDYVSVNKDSVILFPKGNKYVYEQVTDKGGPGMGDELLQTWQCPCTDGLASVLPCLGNEFLNHSYLPLAEAADRLDYKVTADRRPGNLYTNFPCS
uniref:Fibronectin type-III domain-containing protein n=1 Tax=Monopterus albus TaxID=43700 RepID=A0A3Q3K841_MONAL